MKQIILFTILSLLFFQGCAQEAKKNVPQTKIIKETSSYNFQLSNYREDNNELDKVTTVAPESIWKPLLK